jgi:hypothetical protein
MPDLEKAREEWERADGMSFYAYRYDASVHLLEPTPHQIAARTYIAALEAALKAEGEKMLEWMWLATHELGIGGNFPNRDKRTMALLRHEYRRRHDLAHPSPTTPEAGA